MSANQDAPIKVVSIRVKKELWDEMCQRSEVLGLKTQETIEIALKSYREHPNFAISINA